MPEFKYSRTRKGLYDVWLNAAYGERLLSQGICEPREFLARRQVGVIDDVTRSKIVSAEIPWDGGPLRLAVKAYHPRGVAAAVKDYFRLSRAVRELMLCGKLYNAGIPVPEPVLAMELRRFRRLVECWFVSREIVGAKSGYVLVAETRTYEKWPRDARRKFASFLGRAVGSAHAKGYAHSDLNMSHLMITPAEPAKWSESGPDVFFADFEGGRLHAGKAPHGRRMLDLMRFMRSFRNFATESECEEFFKSYAAAFGESAAEAEAYLAKVIRKLGPPKS